MPADREWRRARLHLLVVGALAAALAASVLVPSRATAAPAASPAAGAAASAQVPPAEATRSVWEQTNQVRFDAGLRGLARDSRLDEVAQAWAEQQWRTGKMGHNPHYAAQIPPGWTWAGENVASGYGHLQVVAAWVASPSHYANLVRDYTSIGIGYYEADGRRYWTQVFAKYPGTKVPAKPPVAARPVFAADPAAPDGVPIPLASASFEGGFTGWSAPGARLEGGADARGGRYSLAVPGSRTVSQSVNLRLAPGSTHTATIWVRPGGTTAVSGALKLTALGGPTETATVGFSVSSGWMRVSVPLEVQRSGHTGLRIDVVLGGGDFRLDAASLVTTAGPVTVPAAGADPTPPAPPSRGGAPGPMDPRRGAR